MSEKEAEKLPLPSHVYIPGKTARHPEGFLDHIIEVSPDITTNDTADINIVWQFGLRLLREGYFWEAHEVLEAVWMRASQNSREKFLVQGIIHIANARLKALMGQNNAEARLLKLADECIARAFSSLNTSVHRTNVLGMSDREISDIRNYNT